MKKFLLEGIQNFTEEKNKEIRKEKKKQTVRKLFVQHYEALQKSRVQVQVLRNRAPSFLFLKAVHFNLN